MSNAERALRGVLQTISKEYGYCDEYTTLEQLSTGGANYTSQLYYITLSAPGKDDLRLFAKVATVSESVRAQMPFRIYETETFFYTQLLRKYQQLEERHNVPHQHRLATAKYYGSCEEYLNEVLVLEDLSSKGFETHDRLKSYEWEYAAKSVREMAKLHALSIALFTEEPEEVDKISETLKISMDMEQMKQMLKSMAESVFVVVKEENKARLQSYLNSLEDMKADHYFKVRRVPVIAHGDFRPSNLMHKNLEDGGVEVVAQDYQTLCVSNPICDLFYFIFSGSDEEFRAKHYHQLLDHYYKELCNALARLGVNADSIYSREDFDYEIKEYRNMSDAERALRGVLQTISKEYGYCDEYTTLEQFSTGGANYTSQLYHIKLSAPGKDDLRLFAKVACVSESVRAQMPFRIYETETFFYTQLLRKYQQLEERHNVPHQHRLATAKYYGSCEEYLNEVLVLEDLSSKGFETHDRLKSYEWEYAAKSVREMAKLHALSIALFTEEPEEVDKISETLKISMDMEQMKQMMKGMAESIFVVVKEENKARLQSYLNSLEDMKADHYFKVRRMPVIAHGDFRPSNLMHKNLENGGVEVVAQDYQTLRVSNPICDLFYFIFSGSDEEFRAKHYHQLLDHYYKELCNALARLGVDADSTYSREDFKYEIKEVRSYGLLIGIMMMPVLTVEAENAPDMRESTRLEDFIIKPNELAAKRLNGVINDFIKLGVL
ncbi:unnamed protein product, partial [Iphiclides podalirius]